MWHPKLPAMQHSTQTYMPQRYGKKTQISFGCFLSYNYLTQAIPASHQLTQISHRAGKQTIGNNVICFFGSIQGWSHSKKTGLRIFSVGKASEKLAAIGAPEGQQDVSPSRLSDGASGFHRKLVSAVQGGALPDLTNRKYPLTPKNNISS